MTATLEPVVRPNGKTYQPRKVVTWRWDNDGYFNNDMGCVVIGTHDLDLATAEAASAIRFWFDADLVPTKPAAGWFRCGYDASGPAWIRDEAHGRAGVMFTADYPEETS